MDLENGIFHIYFEDKIEVIFTRIIYHFWAKTQFNKHFMVILRQERMSFYFTRCLLHIQNWYNFRRKTFCTSISNGKRQTDRNDDER